MPCARVRLARVEMDGAGRALRAEAPVIGGRVDNGLVVVVDGDVAEEPEGLG